MQGQHTRLGRCWASGSGACSLGHGAGRSQRARRACRQIEQAATLLVLLDRGRGETGQRGLADARSSTELVEATRGSKATRTARGSGCGGAGVEQNQQGGWARRSCSRRPEGRQGMDGASGGRRRRGEQERGSREEGGAGAWRWVRQGRGRGGAREGETPWRRRGRGPADAGTMRGVLERRVRALRGGRGGGEGIGRGGKEKGEEKGEVERGRSMPEEEGRGRGAPLSLSATAQ